MKHSRFIALLIVAAALSFHSASAQTTPPAASGFRISRIAMSITKVDAMVDFYRSVFNVDFTAMEVSGTKLYTGKLAGVTLLLVPNSLANVKATENRVQFDITVPDMKAITDKVIAHGGQLREQNQGEKRTTTTIVDPDGNTIVVVQEK